MEYQVSQAQITKAVLNILKEQGVDLSNKKIGISFNLDKVNGAGLTAKVTVREKDAAVPAVAQAVAAEPVPAPVVLDLAPSTQPQGTENAAEPPPFDEPTQAKAPVKNIFQEHAERSALKAGQTLDSEGRVVEPDPAPVPGQDGEVLLADPQKLDTQRPKKSLFGNFNN